MPFDKIIFNLMKRLIPIRFVVPIELNSPL
jgi:hypothetical protein